MKAWFARQYGGPEVLRLEEVPMPAPKPGEVLVRVHAATINSGDVRIRGSRHTTAPPARPSTARIRSVAKYRSATSPTKKGETIAPMAKAP